MTQHEQIAEVVFPDDWCTAPFAFRDVAFVGELDSGGYVVAVAGVLTDGTNLLGFTFPGGQRSIRIAPFTDWALEERFTGRELREDRDRDTPILTTYRRIVECVTQGLRETRQELERP